MSEPLYQLAKPVTINEVREQGKSLEWNVYMPCGDVQVYNDESDVFNDFVPLDIPAIQKQLDQDKELFRIASLIGCEPENEERHRKQLVDYLMAEILGLFGLENKETEQ